MSFSSEQKAVGLLMALVALVLGAFFLRPPLVQQTTGFNKFQFVHYLENESNPSDFTQPYSVYEICNPSLSDYVVSDAKGFNVTYVEAKGFGKLASTGLFLAKETTRNISINRPYFLQVNSFINASGDNVTEYLRVVNWTNYSVTDIEWVPFNPIGFKASPQACVKLKVQVTRKPFLGASNIDNVLSFAGYSFPEYAWFNTSATLRRQIKINVTTVNNISNFVVPVAISPSLCTGVQYTGAADLATIPNENGSNDTTTCSGVDYVNITAAMKLDSSFDTNFTINRYYSFSPQNLNRSSPAQVWTLNDTVNVWNFDEPHGTVVDSVNNQSGTPTDTGTYNETPKALVGRSRGFGALGSQGTAALPAYVDVSGNAASGNSISLVTAIRFKGDGVTRAVYVRKEPAATYRHVLLVFGTPSAAYGLHEGCTNDVQGTIDVGDNKWHLIVVTRNATHHWLYVDGVRDGQQLCSGATTRASLTAYIGRQQQDGASPRQFNGSIDYLWLLNRTFTDAEALAMVNASQMFYYDAEQVPLNVTLTNPTNNSVWSTNTLIGLNYSFTNTTNVNNCSLYTNLTAGTGLRFNQSNASPIVPGINNFTLQVGAYDKRFYWNVNCTDVSAFSNFSYTNYSVSTPNAPGTTGAFTFGVNLTTANNSASNDSTSVFLSYNYSGNLSIITNCSLYTNSTAGTGLRFNQSNATPVVGGINNFTLQTGGYKKQFLWNVNCTNATAAGSPYSFASLNNSMRTSNNTVQGGITTTLYPTNVTCNVSVQNNTLVQPYGQTSSVGVLNLTNKGSWPANISMFLLNATNSSFQIFFNTTQNATLANVTRQGNATIFYNWPVGEASSGFVWLYVNCSLELRAFFPRVRITSVAS